MIKKNKISANENKSELPRSNKGPYEKPVVNVILDDERLKAFLLRLGAWSMTSMSALTTFI